MRKLAALWDALSLFLVFAPILTGGLSIRSPDFRFETAQITVAVLILGILALALDRKSPGILRSTLSYRLANAAWEKWRDGIRSAPIRTLLFGAAVFGGLWMLAALRRHWAFGSGAADLGIFVNAMTNLVSGRGYVSSVKDGMNLFADHQSPIFWGLYPIYRLFPYAETLLVAQSWGLAVGAIPLYYLGRQYVREGSWILPALPLFYWAYLPVRNANLFDFHPEVVILPILLGAIACIQSTRLRVQILGYFLFLLSLTCKESAGIVAIGLGLAWILGAAPEARRAFCKKFGIFAVFIGVAVFLFDMKIVPKWVGGKYVYDDLYGFGGGGFSSLLTAPFLHPGEFFTRLFGVSRLKFLLGTLGPVAFLPLLNPAALLVAVPSYASLFLTEGTHRLNLYYYYGIEPAIGVFYALPAAIVFTEKHWNSWTNRAPFLKRTSLPILLLFTTLLFFNRGEIFQIRHYSPNAHHEWLTRSFIPCFSGTSAAVSFALAPHLESVPWVHHLPNIDRPNGDGTRRFVDCIVIDEAVNNWPMTGSTTEALPGRMQNAGFVPVYECGSTRVFQLGAVSSSCMSCAPACVD